MYQKQDVKTWQSCSRKLKRYLSLRHCNLDVDSLCEHHLAHDVHLPHDVMIIMVHDGHQLIYKISRIKTLGPSFSSAMFLVSMTMLPAFVDIQVREGKASREKNFSFTVTCNHYIYVKISNCLHCPVSDQLGHPPQLQGQRPGGDEHTIDSKDNMMKWIRITQ